jgi:hypothetical protein
MRILLLPLGAAVLLSLGACSVLPSDGSTPVASSAAASTSPAPAAASAAAAAPAAHGSGPIPVCTDFPLTVVASATGRSVYTTATERDGSSAGAQTYACEYTDQAPDDALDGFDIAIYRGGDPAGIMSQLSQALTSGTTPLSGIGDRAQAGDGEVDVMSGTDVVVVSDAVHEGQLADLSTSTLEALARKVMAVL